VRSRSLLLFLACSALALACDPSSPVGAERGGGADGGAPPATGNQGGDGGAAPAGSGAGDNSGANPGGATPGGGATPSGGGTPSGGANPGGGAAPGGGANAGGGAPPPSSGGRTLWSMKMGGKGVEWARDVAAAPDGTAVSFNIVGVRGDTLEQIALVRVGADGQELSTRLFDAAGAAFRFSAAGALAIAPAGDIAVAFTTSCSRCPTLAGAAASGATLVHFSANGDPQWLRGLPGEIATNPATGPDGDVVVGSVSGGAGRLRRYLADGTLRWERTNVDLVAGSPVAVDASGAVIYGNGSGVVKLDRDGQELWRARVDGDGVSTTALRAAGGDLVVRGVATSGAFLVGLTSSGDVRWNRSLSGDAASGAPLLAVDADGHSTIVTGADGCGAALAAFDASGGPLWSRGLAQAGCDGGALAVHGVSAAPDGHILVGGALAAPADFGAGPLRVQATDAFLVALSR
jgi:hypothetical protein